MAKNQKNVPAAVVATKSVPAGKSNVPAPAKPTKAPPVVPAKPGAGETGGDDPAEKAKRIPMDEFISAYIEEQQNPDGTWATFCERLGMIQGTAQVRLGNIKKLLRDRHGLTKEQIKEILPPFQGRKERNSETTNNALQMLLGRLSGWNAGSK